MFFSSIWAHPSLQLSCRDRESGRKGPIRGSLPQHSYIVNSSSNDITFRQTVCFCPKHVYFRSVYFSFSLRLPRYVLRRPIFLVFFDSLCVQKRALLLRKRAQVRRKHTEYEGFNVVRRCRDQRMPTKMVPKLSPCLAASGTI